MSDNVVVVGGRVVSEEGEHEADVVVAGGRVAGLVAPGTSDARAIIDAGGCYVLPGGVDAHTHLLSDVVTATRSAAHGGTTTVLSFTAAQEAESPVEALLRGRREAAASGVVDVVLHPRIAHPEQLTNEVLAELARHGARSVKLYLAYPELDLMATDRTLYETLRDSVAHGLLVQVHAENGPLVAALTDELLARGQNATRHFAESRPPLVEEEAVARTLAIAELARAPVYLVHLSCERSVDEVRRARRRGVTAFAEACVHHLVFDADRYEAQDAERYLIVPPLRSRRHVDALWAAVHDGSIDAVATDHATAAYRPDGPRGTFAAAPYGFGGIELRVPLTLSLGWARGVPLHRLVQLLASGPARAFGLYPRKGWIGPGADADLVIWDPEPRWTVDARDLHDGWATTPYEGLAVRGRVRSVLQRGRLLMSDGELLEPTAAPPAPAATL